MTLIQRMSFLAELNSTIAVDGTSGWNIIEQAIARIEELESALKKAQEDNEQLTNEAIQTPKFFRWGS